MFEWSRGKRKFALRLCSRRYVHRQLTSQPLIPLSRDTHVSVELPSLDVMYDRYQTRDVPVIRQTWVSDKETFSTRTVYSERWGWSDRITLYLGGVFALWHSHAHRYIVSVTSNVYFDVFLFFFFFMSWDN